MNAPRISVFASMWCASALLAGCNAAGMQSAPSFSASSLHQVPFSQLELVPDASGKNIVRNGTFDTGKLTPWTSCGTASAAISKLHPYDGHYDALTGSASTKSEPKGWSAICQRVTVPSAATLSAWVYQVGNEPNAKDAYQEIALADAGGKPTIVLQKANSNHAGWKHETWSLAKYAGKSETLFFGVHGKGRSKFYETQFIDDVSLTGTATPPPKQPVATPTTLTFSSATTQTFVLQESGYTGTLTATSSDTSVATVSPKSSHGPTATMTVTPVGGGSCTITVQDDAQQQATVAVTVDNGIIIINRSSVKQ